nr:hypothetical protein [Kibdelosporangium sp. MJ126-NF4]CEL13493.1 hypothetical protein [Kibdelosporangium sp. MJ126-NF4]
MTAEVISFHQFADVFASTTDQVPIVTATEIRYVPDPDPVFVPPRLRVLERGLQSAGLVVVEARAAVGKSMVARHLAHATGGLYWDMSEIHAGHGTLWGRLARTFGTSGLPDVIADLMQGRSLLVIDAVDEAELRSAGRGFDAFLEELGELLAVPRRKPAVVMFGRSETIEYITLVLESKLHIARLDIEEFDKLAALGFIDSRLDLRAGAVGYSAHRRARATFERARDILLNALELNLIATPDSFDAEEIRTPRPDWRSERSRAFLGYAPVLESISGYLDGTDAGRGSNFYFRLANDISDTLLKPAATEGAHWSLLRSIVLNLLDREHLKFVKQAREVLDAAPNAAWRRLYDRDEQLTRILHRTAGREASVPLPAGFALDQESVYRGLVRTTLPNHPFLGPTSSFVNVVMRDFTYAWALSQPDSALRNIVHSVVNHETYQVSPMLGRFHLASADPTSPPTCRAEDIGLIYESLVAEHSVEKRPALIVSRMPDEPEAIMMLGGNDSTASLIRVLEPDNGMRFWRRLSNADIIGGLPVSLGVPDSSFTLGPNVRIHASLFDVPARYIRVSCRHESQVQIFASDGYVSSSFGHHEPEVVIKGTGDFGVHWDDMRFPWVQHASGPPPPPEVDERVLLGDFVLLNRLTTALLAHRRIAGQPNAPARADALWANWRQVRRISTSPRFQQLINHLSECGVLDVDGEYYYLHISELNRRGIWLKTLRTRDLTPAVRKLLEEFSRSAKPELT